MNTIKMHGTYYQLSESISLVLRCDSHSLADKWQVYFIITHQTSKFKSYTLVRNQYLVGAQNKVGKLCPVLPSLLKPLYTLNYGFDGII